MVNDREIKKLVPPGSGKGSYEVGYRRPPKETRFKPGQSGNPRGRPRGKKVSLPEWSEERMKGIILEEAYRTITVRDGERTVDIPVIQAVIRSVALAAAKGHQRSQRMFTDLLSLIERENKALHDEWLKTMIEYKTEWEIELDRRERLGLKGPEPLPHPDHVIVDVRRGTAEVRGPMTKEEKVVWDDFQERKKDWDEEIAELMQMLKDEPDNKHVLEDLERAHRMRALIAKIVPD